MELIDVARRDRLHHDVRDDKADASPSATQYLRALTSNFLSALSRVIECLTSEEYIAPIPVA